MKKLYDARVIQTVYADSVKAIDWDGASGEMHLLKAGIIVTHRCTLRCKLCAERTPYYAHRYHPTLTYLREELDRYFALIDYTMKFEVTGGEPTSRVDLPDLLHHLYRYREQLGRVRVITNGTVPLGERVIEGLRGFGAQADVLIDDYGDALSIHAKRNAELLTGNGIIHILRNQSDTRHFGGWVDFGDLTLRHTREAARTLYRKCAISQKVGFGFRLKGGLLSPCAMTAQCIEFGAHDGNPDEYIDVFDDTRSKREQREKMLRIYEADHLSACQFCNGLCEDSVRYQPAEQITCVGRP